MLLQKQAAAAASAAAAEEGLPAVDKSRPLRSSVLGRDQPEDVHDDYEIGGVLGVGQFGVIRLCTEKASQHKYACKSINKSHLHDSEVEIIRQELQIMHHVAGWLCSWSQDPAAA
jgi:calcium-dependent protein kinase